MEGSKMRPFPISVKAVQSAEYRVAGVAGGDDFLYAFGNDASSPMHSFSISRFSFCVKELRFYI